MLQRIASLYFSYASPWLKRFSPIGSGPVWRRDSLAWLARIEQAHGAISDEFARWLDGGHRVPDKEDLAPGTTSHYGPERWELLHLMLCGERIAPVAPHFPATLAALAVIPDIRTVMFSRLPPERKHIPRHRDGESGTLRMHLGLKVPASGVCQIEIAGQPLAWKVGEAFVMDVGANEHEVRKDADEERIILIVDFLHPLPSWVAWLQRRFYAVHVGLQAKAMMQSAYARLCQASKA
ncbi:aspartyl/asparaginyl beta-hydroxylase domain-containing protein [Tahibacter amnicola]|uniref:Aspartyl/asparaginyl beta-hydroxylase domain-containing protein n=1 Tax=Tahibacter amnicola TaxID=2976241 RepID=A0ABY6B9D1_9GAMM|nr:aspartyl/asparaginyl beta-hydroxylase domain-containing protein [Tahibacter amnicola]UXI66279.1 aspartyl/asparaginyl beta-hydroxylase domain-containing protein [Tahibacter amnicola]